MASRGAAVADDSGSEELDSNSDDLSLLYGSGTYSDVGKAKWSNEEVSLHPLAQSVLPKGWSSTNRLCLPGYCNH
jgi:hypothetical protein